MIISLKNLAYCFKAVELILLRLYTLIFFPNRSSGCILINFRDSGNRPH